MKNKFIYILFIILTFISFTSCKPNKEDKPEEKPEIETTYYNVTINTTDAGTVSKTQDKVEKGKNLVVVATPNTDATFIGWFIGEECISNELTLNYQVNQQLTITAKFNKNIQAVITSISINEASILNFYQDDFDSSKIIIDINKSDKTKEQLTINDSYITKGINNINEPGNYEIEISYQDFVTTAPIIINKNYEGTKDLSFTLSAYKEDYYVTGYTGNDKEVIIPETYKGIKVTQILERAFFKDENIEKVFLPSSIVSIKEAAFYNCTNLRSITIPSSVTKIETHALTGIKIMYLEMNEVPSTWAKDCYDTQKTCLNYNVNLASIAKNEQFEYFVKGTYIIVSDYIDDNSTVEVPQLIDGKNVNIIGTACFRGNQNLTSVTINEGCVKIEAYGFAECINLINISLPSTLKVLAECSFRGCETLQHINLPVGLLEIGKNAFNQDSNLLEMIIPSTVTTIGSYAFSWCVKITKFYFPSSIVTMEVGSCYACSSATIYLESSSIPTSWETGWNMSNRRIIYNATNE